VTHLVVPLILDSMLCHYLPLLVQLFLVALPIGVPLPRSKVPTPLLACPLSIPLVVAESPSVSV
jgi:hypothetical protein